MKRLTKANTRGSVAVVVALLAFADATIAEELFSVNIWSTGRPGSRGGIWGDEGSEDPTDPNRDPDINTLWLEEDEEAGLWETADWDNYQQIPFTTFTAPMQITGSEGSVATIEVVQMRNSGTYFWNQVRDDSDAVSVPNAKLLGSLIRGTEFDDANGGGAPFPARIVDVEVTNLPFESYDVVVYLGTEDGRGPGGTIRVNSEIPDDPTDPSGLPFLVVDGEPDGSLIEISADFDIGNYVLYEGLEDSTLKIQVWGEGFNHVGIAGLQIRGDSAPPDDRFRRGDCNDDGTANISDATCILNWLFAGGEAPGCVAATNTNGDDAANISDATYLLSYLFGGGGAPVAPFPDCGPGTLPADAELGCANMTNCQ